MTIKTLMTTSALSLLLATAAVAQTADTPAPAPAPMESATPETVAPQDLSEMTVGDLNGTGVIDANGEEIGRITDVVQGPAEGEAVVGIGGLLGIGSHDVTLPLSDRAFDPAAEAIQVNLTRAALEAMPAFDSTQSEPLPAETQLASLMADGAGSGTPAVPSGTTAPAAPAPAATAPLEGDMDSGAATPIE